MSMFPAAQNVLINGGQFTAFSGSTGHGWGAERYALQTLEDHSALGAFYNSNERYDAPKCLPRTREAVFREISEWIHVTSIDRPILWLYGPAGAGKSTIAHSIAEKAREMEYLLIATFFFWRSDSERSNADRLVPSLAYQILISIPSTHEFILGAIRENPHIFSLNIKTQIEKLIVEPLASAQGLLPPGASPMVIILDGLDECADTGKRVSFIQVLTECFQNKSLPLIVLCTSRPESDIRTAFNQIQTSEISTRLVLDNQFKPEADIQTFLEHSFTEIKRNHPLKAQIPHWWPSRATVEELIRKSSGQFIYSSTVMKQVASKKHHPMRRLEVVLNVGSSLDVSPFKELDALYQLILSCVEEDVRDTLLRIIGMICFSAGPETVTITPTVVDGVLNLGEGGSLLLLDELHSLIDVHGPSDPLTPFHASFGDFLKDRSRAGVYYVDPKLTLADHTLAYFQAVISVLTGTETNYPMINAPQDIISCPTVELLELVENLPLGHVLHRYTLKEPLSLSQKFLFNRWRYFLNTPEPDGGWHRDFNKLFLFCKRASISSSAWVSIYRRLLSELAIWMERNIKRWSDGERHLSIAVRHEYVRRILSVKLDYYSEGESFLCMVVDVLETEGLPCRWYIDHTWKNLAICDTVLDALVRHSFELPGCHLKSALGYGGICCRGCRIAIRDLLNYCDCTVYLDRLLHQVEKVAFRPSRVSASEGQANVTVDGEEELREAILQYKQKPVLYTYDHGSQLGSDTPFYLEKCSNGWSYLYNHPLPYRFTIFEQQETS